MSQKELSFENKFILLMVPNATMKNDFGFWLSEPELQTTCDATQTQHDKLTNINKAKKAKIKTKTAQLINLKLSYICLNKIPF